MDVEPYLFIGLYLFSFVDFMITEELQCVNQYKEEHVNNQNIHNKQLNSETIERTKEGRRHEADDAWNRKLSLIHI